MKFSDGNGNVLTFAFNQRANAGKQRRIVGYGKADFSANLRAQLYYGVDVSDNFDGDVPRDSESRDDDIQEDGIHFSVSYSRSF